MRSLVRLFFRPFVIIGVLILFAVAVICAALIVTMKSMVGSQ